MSLDEFESYVYDAGLWAFEAAIAVEAAVGDGLKLAATSDGSAWFVSSDGALWSHDGSTSVRRHAFREGGGPASVVASGRAVAACFADECVVIVVSQRETTKRVVEAEVKRVLAVDDAGTSVCFVDASGRPATDGGGRVDKDDESVWYAATWNAEEQFFYVLGVDATDKRVKEAWTLPPAGPARAATPPRGQFLLARCAGGLFVSDGDHAVDWSGGKFRNAFPAMYRLTSARGDAAPACALGATGFAVASEKHGLALFDRTDAARGATLSREWDPHSRPVGLVGLPDRRVLALLTERALFFATLLRAAPPPHVVTEPPAPSSSTAATSDPPPVVAAGDDDLQEQIRARLRVLDAMEAMSERADW